MGRDDLTEHGEFERVSLVIAELSAKLFPATKPHEVEETAEKLIASLFREQ